MKRKQLLATISLFLIFSGSCERIDPETKNVLYKAYKNGEISECKYDGDVVYSAIHNSYDAGRTIYDNKGRTLVSCSYLVKDSSICGELTNCLVIYRSKDNVWGLPGIDKYKLSR